jgi:methylated-DNA-[protein]-cysteine S-methyltransferase
MAEKIIIQYFKTPFGELIIGSLQEKLCLCDWRYRKMRNSIDKRIKSGTDMEYLKGNSIVLEKVKTQLNQYFKGKRKKFDIPFLLIGSDFQKKVWNALLNIPYGKTETYLNLSEKLGDRKSVRTVANANGANAISIIVPCHRIVGSNGEMVGYAGSVGVKKKLLLLEGAIKEDQLSLF